MTSLLTRIAYERLSVFKRLIAGGFVLVPIPSDSKRPNTVGWNSNPKVWLTTDDAARDYIEKFPRGGVGLLHSESGTAALDPDNDAASQAFQVVGIDLAALTNANPYRVRGMRGEKPIWRVPKDLNLKRRVLSWPNLSGKKGPGGRPAPLTIFELRAGAIQDVLPPSIHPGTGQPYTWVGPVPQSVAELPELPTELIKLWERWSALEPIMKAACPWAVLELPVPTIRPTVPPARGGTDVVAAFNTSRTVGELLHHYGYQGDERGPWLYPGSTSGHAGVRLLPNLTPGGHAAVYSHHAADPLGDGEARDAFGIWAKLEHNIDLRRATHEEVSGVIKAAARMLQLPLPRSERGEQATLNSALPLREWGEVRPLPPSTQLVPSLPPELLPPSLADWITDEARAAGLPLEMVAGPVLVGAGGLINHRLTCKNTPNSPAVPANLWGAVCGPPSVRKSHAIQLGAAALNRAQKAEFDRMDNERPALETVRDRAALQLEGLINRLKQSMSIKGDGKSSLQVPNDNEITQARQDLQAATDALKPERFVVTDPTTEKLGEILRDNPQGVALVRDELSAWLANFDRPGREADRGFYLEAANGTGSHTVDRVARGTLFIPQICVGILGSLQPGPLATLLSAQRGAGDGLVQRFQVFIWPDAFPAFDQVAQRKLLNAEVRVAACAHLDNLPQLTLDLLGCHSPTGDITPLIYTPEAQAIYDEWERQHAAAVRNPKMGEAYRAHLGKQPGTFARLALVFHALEVVAVGGPASHPHSNRIGAREAALAAGWCDYLSLHALKLWGEGRRSDVLDAREFLRFVERGSVRDGQTVSEVRAVLAQGKAHLDGPRLQAALKLLEECGTVAVMKLPSGGRGGRPSQVVRIHSQALDVLDSTH